MVKTLISVDPKKAPWEQETPLHNRWHPDIPPVASVKEGEKFRECFSISIGHMYGMLDRTHAAATDDDDDDDVDLIYIFAAREEVLVQCLSDI